MEDNPPLLWEMPFHHPIYDQINDVFPFQFFVDDEWEVNNWCRENFGETTNIAYLPELIKFNWVTFSGPVFETFAFKNVEHALMFKMRFS